MKSGKHSKLSQNATEKSLSAVNEDLLKTIPALQNMLYVLQPQQNGRVPDLPVAFASNALYVLERNGAGPEVREGYENLLLPILRAKVENLHAEGVAQAIWALSNAELT
jgi:hypothetical protein